jgi:hypothetical protein
VGDQPDYDRVAPDALIPRSFTTRLLPDEQLLGVRDVARVLKVCTATVYRLCHSGALPHIWIANTIRFAPSTVAAIVAGGIGRVQ